MIINNDRELTNILCYEKTELEPEVLFFRPQRLVQPEQQPPTESWKHHILLSPLQPQVKQLDYLPYKNVASPFGFLYVTFVWTEGSSNTAIKIWQFITSNIFTGSHTVKIISVTKSINKSNIFILNSKFVLAALFCRGCLSKGTCVNSSLLMQPELKQAEVVEPKSPNQRH